mgnify:FL=1
MKKTTTVLAILLCAVLLVSLAACDDAGSAGKTSGPTGRAAGRG